MKSDIFFDTNVLIYAALKSDARRDAAVAAIERGGTISIQVLNEFAAVARRKLKQPWPVIVDALSRFRRLCAGPTPLTTALHEGALRLAQTYGYGIHDSMILASALDAKCATLLTEDMQHGQLIDGRLTICNLFA